MAYRNSSDFGVGGFGGTSDSVGRPVDDFVLSTEAKRDLQRGLEDTVRDKARDAAAGALIALTNKNTRVAIALFMLYLEVVGNTAPHQNARIICDILEQDITDAKAEIAAATEESRVRQQDEVLRQRQEAVKRLSLEKNDKRRLEGLLAEARKQAREKLEELERNAHRGPRQELRTPEAKPTESKEPKKPAVDSHPGKP